MTNTMPPPEYVKWWVIEGEKLRVVNDRTVEEEGLQETLKSALDGTIYGPTTFKAAFQEFYRRRAEAAGVAEYCHRCGNLEGSHSSWCRVPYEEASKGSS